MTAPRRLLALALVIAVTLGACSGSEDDPAPTPTTVATSAATLAPTVVLTAATPTPPSGEISGALVSDGICQVTIPDDWTDEGTARGRISANARWVLFGNRIASDAAWTTAVDLLKTQQGARPGAVVDEQPDRVTVTQSNNRAIVVRQRFPDRYCELSITATTDPTPEALTLWTQVAAGLEPFDAP